MSSKTISDWILSGGEKSDLSFFHTSKRQDIERLKKSGLPIQKWFELSSEEFRKDNLQLIGFIKEQGRVVIRALPRDDKIVKRKYKKGLGGFEECEDFLRDNVILGIRDHISLSSYISEGSGIIISNPRKVRAEYSRGSADRFAHGEINPSTSLIVHLDGIGHITDKEEWLKLGSEKDRRILKKAMRYLELTRDNFNPLFMRGYFEYVVNKKERIFFIDDKKSEAYLR